MEEGSKRPVEQSLIDLNQREAKDGSDLLMRLIFLYRDAIQSQRQGDDESKEAQCASIMSRSVWPRVFTLLQANGGYDITRQDQRGWTALGLLCCWTGWQDASTPSYQLAERLLQLGADPCQTPLHAPLIIHQFRLRMSNALGLQLLLEYGASINGVDKYQSTIMHRLIGMQHLHIIRQLYQSPQHMQWLDYSIRDDEGMTIAQLAHKKTLIMYPEMKKRETARELYTLILTERHNQRHVILHTLQHHTPIIADLNAIILDYLNIHHPSMWEVDASG